MSDLGDYFSQQSEIEQLKAEVALLRKKLTASHVKASKYKVRWRKLYEKHNPPIMTRGDKAMVLIKQKRAGTLKITLREIAAQCFITYDRVRHVASKCPKT
ncbi:MAG TPA: hypothetical protein EYN67_11160 [Flavobacteriales bacterium]|nr:hypothetical protein [Flavobacteriales bacterium]